VKAVPRNEVSIKVKKYKFKILFATLSLLFIFGCDMAPPNVKFSPPAQPKDNSTCKDAPETEQPCNEPMNEEGD
jgi:hypothetical protein